MDCHKLEENKTKLTDAWKDGRLTWTEFVRHILTFKPCL